jgi:hypothetical protein
MDKAAPKSIVSNIATSDDQEAPPWKLSPFLERKTFDTVFLTSHDSKTLSEGGTVHFVRA